MIRYRNMSTGWGTLLPARSMTSSSRADATPAVGGRRGCGHRILMRRRPVRPVAEVRAQAAIEQPRPEAGAAPRPPGLGRLGSWAVPAMSRWAHGSVADELLEEQGGRDRPGVRAAHVLDVRDVRVELAPVARARAGNCHVALVGARRRPRAPGRRGLVVADDRRRSTSPSARIVAPVRVAMSTIASGSPASAASTRPSAMTRRPSASVLMTSTVVPPRIVMHVAERAGRCPDGMLSVHMR